MRNHRGSFPSYLSNSIGQSFKNISGLAAIKRDHKWYVAKVKSMDELIKRVGWISKGNLIDETNGQLVNQGFENEHDELAGEEQFNFILQHRLELLTHQCIDMYFSNEDEIGFNKQSEALVPCGDLTRFYLKRFDDANTLAKLEPGKFSAIRLGNILFTYPNYLIYLLKNNKYLISQEFKAAILFGKPLKIEDVYFQEPSNRDEFYSLKRFYKQHQQSNFFTNFKREKKNYIENGDVNLPQSKDSFSFQPDAFTEVNAEMWMNLDLAGNLEHDEYKLQPFIVPTTVNKDELNAILGKQSLDLLAIAEMANAFKLLKELCEQDEELANAINDLMTDKQKMSAFTRSINDRYQNMDYRKALVERSNNLYPL